MAFAFNVKELRSDRTIAFAGTKDQLKISWRNQYAVEVTASGADELKDVSPVDVVQATGLPIVNRSVYYFNGKIIPFVICRNKTATQDARRISRWIVTCSFETDEPADRHEDQEQEQTPPAAITDITPRVEVIMEEKERVIYQDYSTPSKRYMTPVNTFFADPLIERVPILKLRITQYEASITFQQILDRKLKCNSDTYRTKAAYTWLIEQIEAIDAIVQLSGGPSNVAQVSYTITYDQSEDGAGDPIGHQTERPLITWYYLDQSNGNKKTPFVDDLLETETTGFIDIDGHPKDNGGNTTTLPDYIRFKQQPTIAFGGFMQA